MMDWILGAAWRVFRKTGEMAFSAGIAADRGIEAGRALLRGSPLLRKRYKAPERERISEAPPTWRSGPPE